MKTEVGLWTLLAALALALSACGAQAGGEVEQPPPSTREPLGPPTPTPQPVSVSDETTDVQLEVFRFIWDQVDQSYAYGDYNGVDWDAIRNIYQTQVEDGMTEEMFQAAMQAMISELGDGSSFYITPEEVATRLEAQEAPEEQRMGYIGTLVGMPDGTRQQMTILYVFPDSPAEEAGVLPHDVIVGIEGEPVPDEPEDAILDRIRGELGTEVTVTVQAPDGPPRVITVGRGPLGDGGEVEARVINQNIGYIFIPPGIDEASLGVRVTNELRAMREEDGIQALIIDLRIARVGPEWPLDEMLGLFVHGEAYELYNAAQSQVVSVTGKDVAGSQELPLVVLVGYDTDGMSEIFAGALQALGRATIVGGQTRGGIAVVFNLPVPATEVEDAEIGGVLVLPIATARSLEGHAWGRVGVTPDKEIDLLWEDFSAENDSQLAAAAEAAKDLTR
jgi:carboxyl-terminal processing protease